MVHFHPNEIVVVIKTQNPVEDLISMQHALLAMIQHVDPVQLGGPQTPLYYYVELLRNLQPDQRQMMTLLKD
jgi:hypothetical protein